MLTDGRFSPDGKWMAFHARTKKTTAQVFVVPLDGVLPVPRSRWIEVTDGGSEEMEPAWSPTGDLLYFLSDRDGFRCIWARRLNGADKQPSGEAFAVRHFHRARRSLRRMTSTTGLIGLSVAPGRTVFSFGELTGNIWLRREAAMKISVIVVTRNEGAELRRTVENLRDTLPARSEIVIVDDASTDGSAAGFRRAIRAPGIGVARARNLGAAHSKGDVLVFADGHIRLDKLWWQPLADAAEDRRVAAVAPGVTHLPASRRLRLRPATHRAGSGRPLAAAQRRRRPSRRPFCRDAA